MSLSSRLPWQQHIICCPHPRPCSESEPSLESIPFNSVPRNIRLLSTQHYQGLPSWVSMSIKSQGQQPTSVVCHTYHNNPETLFCVSQFLYGNVDSKSSVCIIMSARRPHSLHIYLLKHIIKFALFPFYFLYFSQMEQVAIFYSLNTGKTNAGH